MSPEPTHAHNQNNLDTKDMMDNDIRIIAADSEEDDNDDEMGGHDGYMPLSSEAPNDNQHMLNDDDGPDDDSDEEDYDWTLAPSSSNQMTNPTTRQISQTVSPETMQVWSTPTNRPSIDLDAEKISQVKSLMSSFTLPSSVIPEWASTISQDQWKELLIDRITQIQKIKSKD